MKKNFVTLCMSITAFVVLQSVSFANESTINLAPGSWSVSTSKFDMVVGSAQSVFTVSPTVEYFIKDGLAVGGIASVASGTQMNAVLSVGPAASLHFWQDDHLSAYTSSSFVFGNITKSNNLDLTYTFNLGIGANYNFTSWFGIGPRLNLAVSNATNVELGLINLFVYL